MPDCPLVFFTSTFIFHTTNSTFIFFNGLRCSCVIKTTYRQKQMDTSYK